MSKPTPAADADPPAPPGPCERRPTHEQHDPAHGAAPPGEVLARLVRDHQAEVWRYLRFLGAEPHEADDLTQETFLAVARAAFAETSDAQTRAYLRTVARRGLLMLRRKESRRVREVDLEAAEAVWGEALGRSAGDWGDHLDAARGCVERLEGRAAQAIDLQYKQSESRDAIAARLGMTTDGVKTLLRRTRAKLRVCIEQTLARQSVVE
ncbi:sigma-70 family RNA polymerase sigma factor [Botrimarina sp.]|uniref:RNA polymerase sigma factor n=1 Tax=Botrimarina sp. TaxID=2795802 RepID=UPI0032EE4192